MGGWAGPRASLNQIIKTWEAGQGPGPVLIKLLKLINVNTFFIFLLLVFYEPWRWAFELDLHCFHGPVYNTSLYLMTIQDSFLV
jgi:hypothetical protein